MNAGLTSFRPDTVPVGGAILASAAANNPVSAQAGQANTTTPAAGTATKSTSFGFSDVLAILNPLQHLPVVGTLYREWTGDTISPAARIAGDTLYGGFIGLATSIADSVIEGETGKDFGSHIYDTLFGESTPATPAPAASTQGSPAGSAPVVSAAPGDASGFMATMQHGGMHKRAVPLATSVPIGEAYPGQRAANTASLNPPAAASTITNDALANAAQQSINAYSGGSPPAAPPPTAPGNAVPAAPVPNPLAATPPAGVSNLMLQALDKYNAMAKQNGVSGSTVSLTN